MDQHDKSFMTTFVVVLSILVLITVLLIFGANLVAKLAVKPDDGVRRLAVANERIKPVAQVFVTGQERPKTAAPTAVPVKVAQVQQTGEQIYTGKCAACHVAGVLGAPKLVKSDWEPRFAQGLDTLVSHAVNGIRSMPAKGGHPDLTEQDIRNTVIYMLKTSGFTVAEEEVMTPAEVAPEPPVTAPVVAVAPPPVAPEQALVATTPPVQPIETPPPPAVPTTPPSAAPVEPQVPVIAAVPPPASPATVPPGVTAPPVVTAADTSALATLTAQATAAAAQASAAAAQASAAAAQAAAAASQAAAAAAQVAQAVSSAPASPPAPTEAPTPIPVPTEATPPTPTVAPSAPAQPAPVPPAKAAEPAALAPPVVPEPPAPKALPPVTTPVPQAVPPVALTTPSPATAAITLPEGLDLVRGQQTYNTACIVCHLSGVAGSPKLGDKAAWQPRLAQGFETLVKHALEGYKGMPARGARLDLPDQEIINAIGYMVVQSQ